MPTIDGSRVIENELSGGQKATFRISFAEGQYARIIVEQRGIDVIVRLLGADGKALLETDADPRKVGEEVIEFTTTGCTGCQLAVVPRQKNAPAGHYAIRVAELRTATEKDFTLNEARHLASQATQLWRQDKYDEALPLAERALAIREKELGPMHLDVATSLFSLANIWDDKGDSEKAEGLYLHAIEIREKAVGRDDISMSPILNNLGVLYKERADYVKAEEYLQRAFEIREKNLEPDHLLIAGALNNLATVEWRQGDNAKAEPLFQRVIDIRIKALGPEHPDVATALNNLANVYVDPKKAEELYTRALNIREKALGPDHPDVGQSLYNLALLYAGEGNETKAEDYAHRAQNIFEKALGPDHPFVAYPLNLRAGFLKDAKDYAQSEALYLRAIAISEKSLGKYHPDLAGTLTNLANLYVAKGDLDKAIATQARANEIYEYNIRLNLAVGSEGQKRTYLTTVADIEDQTIMLHLHSAPGSQAAAMLAINTVLQRKARVLDATANNLEVLRRRSNEQDRQLLDQLTDTTKRLASLVFNGPQDSPAQYEQKIHTLDEQRDNLENEISVHSAGFYQQTAPVTVNSVRATLPADAALLEFAVYRPIVAKPYEFVTDRIFDPDAIVKPRYVAYIVRAQGDIVGIDLGEKIAIDDAVASLRKALRDPGSTYGKVAHAAEEKILGQLRPHLDGVTQLLISPEGDLNLIPFEVLADEHGHFLIEHYSVSYLTTGRDLLRLQVARTSPGKPIVLGDPIYGERNTPTLAASAPRKSTVTTARRSVTSGDDLSSLYFAPLPGTAQEARTIKSLFPEAHLLLGAQATKKELEAATAPQILHIATHGFFLQDIAAKATQPEKSATAATRSASVIVKFDNPLLRSGLALTGANLRANGNDKGILTALEASNLNLWGTKLVTLSACDTGVGDIRDGEGVYGLRRAFVLAGSESLIMSLWPVSDYVTRELMTSYYAGLKKGMGRGEALRQTKLAMLKKKDRRHPFYWASFIQSGEWANLDGQRH